MEGWDGTVSLKRCLNRDPWRMSQKAIRGKRLPSTSKSKHEHPRPGAHLACSQPSEKASMAGVHLGRELGKSELKEASGWIPLDTGT